tara:strand:- start:3415 stop:4380 length:966 start_codon:yes stop_codon:yes gene_type:complete
MSKKILFINNNHYNHSSATLLEGLIENKEEYDLDIYATTPYNYALIKDEWDFVVYSKELVDKLIDICDVIIMVNDNFNPTVVPVDVKKIKGVYLDSNDRDDYLDTPINYKFYLKREMKIGREHLENVFPFWFAAENRYFWGGRDFEKIWSKKKIPLSCMMGKDKMKPWRFEINDILKWNYETKQGWVLDTVYGGNDDDKLNTDNRNHSAFFDTLLESKVSVDSYGAGLANNTGRFFESLACGCSLFYQPITTYLPNTFTDGENIMIYDSTVNLIDKINSVIDDDKKIKDLAYAGFNHMLSYHTTKRRGYEFLEICKGYNLI